jgi:hypothetical protein
MICGNIDCKKEFNSRTHNQKYCSDECCRIATNKRIMEKYYEKKAIRKGSIVKKCKKCKSSLSKYQTEDLCASCIKKKNKNSKDKLLRMIDEIS